MKILVSGKNSQIGQEFFRLSQRSNDSYIFTDSESMNLLNKSNIEKVILENTQKI